MGAPLWSTPGASVRLYASFALCRHPPYRLTPCGSRGLRSPARGLGGGAPECGAWHRGGRGRSRSRWQDLARQQEAGRPWRPAPLGAGAPCRLDTAQQGVDDKTNESPVALDLLRQLVLEGRIVTMDAVLTQRQMAQQIVDA